MVFIASTPANQPIVASLRRLFMAEHASPCNNLVQAMPYVPMSDSAEKAALIDVIREDQDHQAWLAQLLIERGTAPPPASYQNMVAGMHFQRLAGLIPLLVQAEKELIATYEAESGHLATDESASRRVIQILQRHQRHLGVFQRLHGGLAA